MFSKKDDFLTIQYQKSKKIISKIPDRNLILIRNNKTIRNDGHYHLH